MGIRQDLYEKSNIKLLATATGGGSSSTYQVDMTGSMDGAMIALVGSQPASGSALDIDHATSRGGTYSNLITLTTGQQSLSSDASAGDEIIDVAAVTNFNKRDIIEIDDTNTGNTEQKEIAKVDSNNGKLHLVRGLDQAYASANTTVYTAVKRKEVTSYEEFIEANSLANNDVAFAAFIIAGKTRT